MPQCSLSLPPVPNPPHHLLFTALELIFHPSRGLCNFASHFWHFICLRLSPGLGLERLHGDPSRPRPVPGHILARSLARFSRAAVRPVRNARKSEREREMRTRLDSVSLRFVFQLRFLIGFPHGDFECAPRDIFKRNCLSCGSPFVILDQ